MNILFFLTPKSMCAYLEDKSTLRQALERMEVAGYAALPILNEKGEYCGTLTEGDMLWAVKNLCGMDLRQTGKPSDYGNRPPAGQCAGERYHQHAGFDQPCQ
ncbi:MAG: CBS domain-containing protein [Oscillospiraceae bacterium]